MCGSIGTMSEEENIDNPAADAKKDAQSDTPAQPEHADGKLPADEQPSEEDLESWSSGSDATKKSWYAIPTAAWAIVILALILVGAAGYLVGKNNSSIGDEDGVNMAGVAAGTGKTTPVPDENGKYKADIYGPQANAKLEKPEDIVKVHRRDENDPFALGAADAPVVISVFSDFECPFCAKFANETEPFIVDKYVNKGLVRLEWNDFAINGDKAVKDAQAGRAAAAQGKFWEFARILFKKSEEKGTGHPEFTEKELIDAARDAGVEDMKRFEAELKEGKWKEPVTKAYEYGSSMGMNATPMFVIGSKIVSGAQPLSAFEDNIELELMHVKRADN